MMAAFRPRIGEQDKSAADAGRRQILKEWSDVVRKDSDIGQVPPVHAREQTGDAVHVGLGANETDGWVLTGLPKEMLPTAEADLEPDILLGLDEQLLWVESTAPPRGDLDLWQEILKQGTSRRAQPSTGPPAIEPLWLIFGHVRLCQPRGPAPAQAAARCNSLTRSVFSQENPPSGSGSRPKWP